MKNRIVWAAPLAALVALAAAPPWADARSPVEPDAAKPKAARHCFWAHSVNGFAARDEHFVNVRVGVKEVYELEMFGPCQEVDWANRIALVSRGSSHICTGLDAEIVSPTTLGPRRCAVRNIRKLTPAEISALPSRAKP